MSCYWLQVYTNLNVQAFFASIVGPISPVKPQQTGIIYTLEQHEIRNTKLLQIMKNLPERIPLITANIRKKYIGKIIWEAF